MNTSFRLRIWRYFRIITTISALSLFGWLAHAEQYIYCADGNKLVGVDHSDLELYLRIYSDAGGRPGRLLSGSTVKPHDSIQRWFDSRHLPPGKYWRCISIPSD